jgi:hypothetical protein
MTHKTDALKFINLPVPHQFLSFSTRIVCIELKSVLVIALEKDHAAGGLPLSVELNIY